MRDPRRQPASAGLIVVKVNLPNRVRRPRYSPFDPQNHYRDAHRSVSKNLFDDRGACLAVRLCAPTTLSRSHATTANAANDSSDTVSARSASRSESETRSPRRNNSRAGYQKQVASAAARQQGDKGILEARKLGRKPDRSGVECSSADDTAAA